ncbi:LacI family DNA-binding transcriptional regulator [Clostridium sp. NSJ-145]|uniref:LacI family DNA-binding transcriptional regulator n=1 Tax=Clostridium sp. NSJ-145 TaxID=2897777 RepID=UPI001E3DFA69|nr:LacI family DNA-binding transcriptional regulator [Clostridium sp. NSJ-145]MCD2502814.1 LacI family DNA-binding transcriptional regulator [Clostridium sp. NSJ-145]
MINMRKVAEEANVSVATVSRVLNGSNNVSIKTKLKVLKVIEEYNYEPNMLGQNLRKSKTKIILVLVPNISNPFYSQIVHGINRTCFKNGYYIMICETELNENRVSQYLSLIKKKLADGMITLDPHIDKEKLRDLADKYPVVQCCEYDMDSQIPYVTIDNTLAAYKAVNYLITLGHRKIAIINSDERFIYSRLRKEGYLKALKEHNIEINEKWIINSELDFISGQSAVKHLMVMEDRPTAIFAVSDILAIGAIKGIKELNLNVPSDVSVIGFDNIEFSNMITPALTTISQPMYNIGKEAAKMIINKLENKNVEIYNTILESELIIRESTNLNS